MAEAIALNPAISYSQTFAIYVEGIKCAFSTAQVMTEEGGIPVLYFTVPATPEMRRIAERARVHCVAIEPTPPYSPVVMGEFEIAEKGFDKSTEGRNLVFTALHVTSHLDQYSIMTLDITSSIRALGGATELTEGSLVTATGSILEYLEPNELKKALDEFNATAAAKSDPAFAAFSALPVVNTEKAGTDTGNVKVLTVGDVVFGAFLIYRKFFQQASRLSNTYTNSAMDIHQLAARFQYPPANLINWPSLYTKLITEFLVQGTGELGGRQTLMDLVRSICQFFLYQVTVIPNAESVTKQIQIKPMTYFNAIPHCNVFFPCMTGSISFKENFTTKPTRMQTMFVPAGVSPKADLSAFQQELTLFAPADLQFLWQRIVDATRQGQSKTTPKVLRSKKALVYKKPADGIPFVTLEEDQRGIVALQYALPALLNNVILSQTFGQAGALESAQPTLPPADTPERAAAVTKQLTSPSEDDRVTKYRAFLCLVLGDGSGIQRAKDFPTSSFFSKGKLSRVHDLVVDTYMVPDRITLMTHPVTLDFFRSGIEADLKNCGANYIIGERGQVVQLRKRNHHTFAQPEAIPYGISLSGVPTSDAVRLNAQVPPKGVSYSAWQRAFRADCKDLVMGNSVAHTITIAPSATNLEGCSVTETEADSLLFMLDSPNFKYNGGQAVSNDTAFLANLKPGSTMVYLSARDVLNREVRLPSQRFVVQAVHTRDTPSRLVIRLGGRLPTKTSDNQPILYTVSITNKASLAHFKPWLFCTSPVRTSPTAINTALIEARKNREIAGRAGISAESLAPGSGNERNLVIAFATTSGRLTEQQKDAAAFLIAAVQELAVEKPGTSKQPNVNQASRAPRAPKVVEVSSYFGNVPLDTAAPRISPGDVPGIVRKATTYRTALFKEFTKWDNELNSNKFVPFNAIVKPGDVATDESLPVPFSDNAKVPASADFSPLTNQQVAENESAIDAKLLFSSITDVTKGYLRGYLNFQFYNARVAPQNMTLPMPFNPYVTVGYPCLVLDNAVGGYDLVGYAHAVSHEFTPNSGSTTVTVTHLRRSVAENPLEMELLGEQEEKTKTEDQKAKEAKPGVSPAETVLHAAAREAIIPFSKQLHNQFVFITPLNESVLVSDLGGLEKTPAKTTVKETTTVVRKGLLDASGLPAAEQAIKQLTKTSTPAVRYTNREIVRDPVLYFKYLNTLASNVHDNPAIIPTTFLPIQLHDLETKLPPLFVYHGGFGLGRIDQVKTANAKTGVPEEARNFTSYAVYLGYNDKDNNQKSTSPESHFVFADTIGGLDRKTSQFEAYKFIWRGVQRVGQNNLQQAQSSLVDYADLGDIINNSQANAQGVAASIFSRVFGAVVDDALTDPILELSGKGIPDALSVYKVPPTYKNGKKTADGKLLVFDDNIRTLVIAHNSHVENREVLANLDNDA